MSEASEKPKPWWYDWTDKTCTNCEKGIFRFSEQIEKYGLLVCDNCGFTKIRFSESEMRRAEEAYCVRVQEASKEE